MPRVWKPTPEELEKLDAVRRRLADWILEDPRARNWKKLSQMCDMNETYFHQFMQGNKPQELPERVRTALSRITGIDEALLLGPRSVRARQSQTSDQRKTALSAGGVSTSLPEMGRPIVGTDALRMEGGAVQGYVPRPPMVKDRDAFTILVNGSSMEPRFSPGDRVYVEPMKPLIPGRSDVFIVLVDDTAILRRLVEVREEAYIVRQFSGGPSDGLTTLRRDQVSAIAVVTWRGPSE